MHADVQAIGAGAVNQAIKAIAIAHGYLEQDGLEIVCVPAFVEIEVSGEERTAIKFSVEVRRKSPPPAGSRLAAMAEPPPLVVGHPPREEQAAVPAA
jgi:stage V sporulation protein SpoVS